jgi:hypothetical protein
MWHPFPYSSCCWVWAGRAFRCRVSWPNRMSDRGKHQNMGHSLFSSGCCSKEPVVLFFVQLITCVTGICLSLITRWFPKRSDKVAGHIFLQLTSAWWTCCREKVQMSHCSCKLLRMQEETVITPEVHNLCGGCILVQELPTGSCSTNLQCRNPDFPPTPLSSRYSSQSLLREIWADPEPLRRRCRPEVAEVRCQ